MVTPAVLCAVPWSAEPPGLPLCMEQVPRTGWVVPEEVRAVPAPVRVRRDGAGELWATNGADRIVHCGGRGVIALPEAPLLDFAVISGGTYALLDRVNGGTRLRWHRDGQPAWHRDGDFGKILTDGRRIYTSDRHGPTVFEWSSATGDLVGTLSQSPDAGEPYLVDGQFCAVFTDFDAGCRGVELLAAADNTVRRSALKGDDRFAWLVQAIGFDKHLRVYAVRDGQVARLATDGEIALVGSVGTDVSPTLLTVDPDGGVLYTTATTGGATVWRLPPPGTTAGAR